MILLDGKSISNEIYKTLKCKVDVLLKKKITPTLAIIQIGKNPASEIYVKNKIAKCDTLKIKTN
jgi:methylenetetrahydrofolate dehydrogenase (NADP+)/methenyltetrahydrofolate cyclohydrolase